jgi:hypothetical protein
MNIQAKIFNNTLVSRIQQYMQKVIHHDQAGFIQECMNSLTHINQ